MKRSKPREKIYSRSPDSHFWPCDQRLWLSLLICSLMANTAGLHAVAQEPELDKTPASTTEVRQPVATDTAGPSSTAESAADQPPRPSQPLAAAEASAKPEPSDDAGVRSSTWTQTPGRDAIGHELSIEPGTLPLLPEDAPAWVGSLPDLTDDVHRLFVGGQIAESESEAVEGLDAPLEMAVRQYVEEDLLRRPGAGAALSGKLTADYVWKNLIDQRSGYVAKLNTPTQPMYQKWVTVEITPEQRAEIQRWHREAVQRKRLAPIGVGVASLLGCVGLLHLILRRKPGRAASRN